jgi:hypothetical protein
MNNVIGLVGFIGSGKDTVAKMLASKDCVQDSFASPLKDLCASVFGWDRSLLEGDTIESRDFRETPDVFWTRKLNIDNFTPRLALQLLGTDVMRNHFDKDIWLNSLEYRIRKRHAEETCVVISDARFRNELSLIHQMNGVIIWVQRGDLPEWYDIAKTAYDNAVNRKIMQTRYRDIHESEWNWAGYPVDYIINNNGSIEDLQKQVSELRQKLSERQAPTLISV